jgi:hypothetical protein
MSGSDRQSPGCKVLNSIFDGHAAAAAAVLCCAGGKIKIGDRRDLQTMMMLRSKG